jgi:hypothetical protein
MLAKILIPVTGATPDSGKPAGQGSQSEARPSFLLIPALPIPDTAIRAAK